MSEVTVIVPYETWHVGSCLWPINWFSSSISHHVQEHDDAEVDADRRARGRHLRVVPDEGPAEGGEGADGDHAINHDAEHGGDHH